MREWLRILSIDGGGIRGLFSALVLAEIERRTGYPIGCMFDLIAGCSSGSILTLGLALPGDDGKPVNRTTQLIRMLEEDGPVVFSASTVRLIRTLGGLAHPRYERRHLAAALRRYFAGRRLGEAATDVLIPCYALETRNLALLTNREAGYRQLTLVEVALAGSAAQVFFPPVQVVVDGHPLALTDAGVFVGSPAMLAYTYARSSYDAAENVLLVSVGVGKTTEPFPYRKAKDWGAIEWVWPLLEITADGLCDMIDTEISQLFSAHTGPGAHHYFRCDYPLGPVSAHLDDVSPENLAALKAMSAAYVRDNTDLLDELCRLLVESMTAS